MSPGYRHTPLRVSAQRETLLEMIQERSFLRTLFGWRGRGSRHR